MHKVTLQYLSGVNCLLSFGLCHDAEHRPLLPLPQKTQYGDAPHDSAQARTGRRSLAWPMAPWRHAEYEYWRQLQAGLWEFADDFKDGDTLPRLRLRLVVIQNALLSRIPVRRAGAGAGLSGDRRPQSTASIHLEG